jgi:hypothetical protein
MTIEIDETLEVRAPADLLWEVITDLDRYGEWNPFVVACRSSLRQGDPIEMKVQIFESFVQSQRETILDHVPGERLCYGLAPMPLGALASRRCHEVIDEGPATSRYRSHFVLSGWLSPITRALLGSRLDHGFRSMTRALVQRAEFLCEERSP